MQKKLEIAANLDTFFEQEVSVAAKKQGLTASHHACAYLARVLSKFSETNRYLVENNLDGEGTQKTYPTLALLWMESIQSPPTEQFFKLQQLGDIALFTTGFFKERLDRKSIDMDYYFAMGEQAYERAGKLRESIAHESALNVYFELASSFTKFVDVFAELADQSLLANEQDILKLYEKWLKTKNFRISRMLGEVGIITKGQAPRSPFSDDDDPTRFD